VLRFIWAQLRGRPRRTLALLAGVLVATTGFTVLSAGAAVQQLQVEGTVADNYRAAYDILVRPKDSRTAMEEDRGLVAPNYLSGMYGGITLAQLDQVRAVGNVEIAAPIAMLGYTFPTLRQTIDLTDQLDPSAERQVLRVTPRTTADRGLTAVDDAPVYVYVTRNRLLREKTPGLYEDGTRAQSLHGCTSTLEVEPDGTGTPLCTFRWTATADNGMREVERTQLLTVQLTADGGFVSPGGQPKDRLLVDLYPQVSVLVAAIDPEAEARLVGLDDAVVDGRYLSPDDEPANKRHDFGEEEEIPGGSGYRGIPAMIADTTYVDEQTSASVERLGSAPADAVPGKGWTDWVATLGAAPATTAPKRTDVPTPDTVDGAEEWADVGDLFQPGPVTYRTGADGVLHAESRPVRPASWDMGLTSYRIPRMGITDGFRPLTHVDVGSMTLGFSPALYRVGTFDPGALRGFPPLAGVPMETYQAPQVTGADARSRELLGDRPLLPNSNPAGYLTTPPLALTNLYSMQYVPPVMYKKDPISAIRVRVAGVTGVDERSQELVRSTAERITTTTGLDVDITIGASPAQQTVALPAGQDGRPALTLSESWSQKGVAVAIVAAADRKSVVLFGLILVVCALFLGNAVAATVRERRQELAVLACLGWPARRLAGLVVAEVVAVGLVAGLVAGAAAAALPGVSWTHALVALPAGLGVAVFAAGVPALSAARARPWAAVQPAVADVRRARRGRGLLGLAIANLRRVPGRTALGAGSLAVGVAALTVLLVVAVVFRNDVVGTVLGDAVAVRVRDVDVFAAVTAVVLGVLMVADVLYINVRERAGELALLWAAGWPDRALLRLVGYEALCMGALGAVVGGGVGLAAVAWFAGRLDPAMVLLTGGIAVAAVAVAGVAAVVPALALRRLPLSTLLAEE
jgi:hypothetical protein